MRTLLMLVFSALVVSHGRTQPAAQPTADPASVSSSTPSSATARTIAISGAAGGTDFSHASVALRVPWKRKGGDSIDANGVPNGPTPHARVKLGLALATLTFDIEKIDGDLLLRFEGGHAPSWSSPLIDGAPAD